MIEMQIPIAEAQLGVELGRLTQNSMVFVKFVESLSMLKEKNPTEAHQLVAAVGHVVADKSRMSGLVGRWHQPHLGSTERLRRQRQHLCSNKPMIKTKI